MFTWMGCQKQASHPNCPVLTVKVVPVDSTRISFPTIRVGWNETHSTVQYLLDDQNGYSYQYRVASRSYYLQYTHKGYDNVETLTVFENDIEIGSSDSLNPNLFIER